MEDSSFAIHPENEKNDKKQQFVDIGKMKKWFSDGETVRFHCENGFVNIRFYRDDIARVVMNPQKEPTMEQSFAVVKSPEKVSWEAEEREGIVTIRSSKLIVTVHPHPLRIHFYGSDSRFLLKEGRRGMAFGVKGEVICFKEMAENDHFYGFGEKTSFLDKRGEKMTMWNTDVFAPHNPEIDAMYQSIPYFMTIRNGKAHGLFFDNTFKTVFDMKSNRSEYSFWAEGGELDYYLLAGPSPKDVLDQYTTLTGRMELPPKWALGYHQSRYSYKTEAEVRDLVKTFKEKEIPLDAIYLDIHYMDEYRVFTFDKRRFPNPRKLVQDLKKAGIQVVPIVDPGVKEDPEYPIYQEGIRLDQFCKYIEGDVYFGDVWPGKSAFPDFSQEKVRKWWGKKQTFYTDLGIEGIWNDMNEPAVFNETKTMDLKVIHENDGNPKTHRELHNVYGLFMGEATYNGLKNQLNGKRPFVLTRAGFSGIQRYAAVWTGDNRSFWEHLQMTMPMCLNLGMSGIALTGSDVGGFAHDATGELLARWTQLGAFMPFFRNHSNIDTVRQEPWAFGEEIESIVKTYIQLRYRMLPYFYTFFRAAHLTGVPVMRPLVMEYPDDPNVFNLFDQFLVGEHLLVAPITLPSTYHRVVYLPKGIWYDYWTNKTYEGGTYIMVEADLATLPLFVKAGSIIPEEEGKKSAYEKTDTLTVNIYLHSEPFTGTIYEDDGETFQYREGKYWEESIRVQKEGKSVKVDWEEVHGGYKPHWKNFTLKIHGADEPTEIWVNGKKVEDKSIVNENGAATVNVPFSS
ncbi:glycoside hydrolase family 31 protein [Bacillus sp. FSL W8-1127]|uniref:glycoside hydrolase family 31 protein n=1 Tax=Bacillus sp. FSL W8-1127 TaxID=2954710 RepID=UPI0030F9010A